MQRSWLRSFAEHHRPMLYWLVCVAIAAVGVTLVLWSATHDATFALLAVPLLLLAGLAAALVEIVQAFRCHHGDPCAVGFALIGTMGLGVTGLPIAVALVFATIWIADGAAMLRCFPIYQHVVAGVQRGTIVTSDTWQQHDGIEFMTGAGPSQRVVFRLSGTSDGRSGIIYDPTGDVMMRDPASLTAKDAQHRIGHASVRNCRATLITAYYRCDLWEFDEDDSTRI